ncbi:EscU/YscU/HrcU family type III secretion system export apparatus switch protein [Sneathiella chinensis]|uniref:Flagellar protein FhlB n=1 Tax=Sneathiella chinensis TaxID=349750 RepID=A0ABQ5U6C9_9PROT|nr:EscU/YscU/HrcU family type III secretion system export apparatus switch protein [Sneathiella chinensis]GLQ07336.1 hypothetical protein GCM10007924_25570 [Sneathiella chinensis]
MPDDTNKPQTEPGKKRPAIAIALSQQGDRANTPTITATGRGEVAEQILRLAFDNDVKVREDSDLAEILSQVDVDTPIPLEAFAAVSEILSYLYRLQDGKETRVEFDVDVEDKIP